MIELWIYGLLNILISVFMLISTYLFWKKCLFCVGENVFIDLIFQLLLVKELLYYVLPSITHVFFNWEFQKKDGVAVYEISAVYFIEYISLIIYFLCLYFLCKYKRLNLQQNRSERFDNRSKYITFFILLFYILFLFQDFKLIELPYKELFELIKPFMLASGTVLCFFVICIGRKKVGALIFFVALVAVALNLIFSMFSGVRGKLFWPVFWMLFVILNYNRNYLKKYILYAILLLSLLVLFQGGLLAIRGSKDLDIIELVRVINSSKDEGDNSFFEEVDFRFGAMTHYSVGFLRMYNRGYIAGINPIKNSLYSPIPRSLMEDKPAPCSVDGDIYSMGMYKTYAEIGKIDTNMVEFSTGCHAYWEFGILGILFLSMIPAFYIFSTIRLFGKFGILGLPLFLSVLKPWGYNEPKIWVSEIILQIPQIIIPALLLLFIYSLFNKKKK